MKKSGLELMFRTNSKKEAKKYLNKYFKEMYINEDDMEYKSLVRIFNKLQKQAKNI